MRAYYGEDQWNITITHIKETKSERVFLTPLYYVLGTAQVETEEETFSMDFTYSTSNPEESPEKLMAYLRGLAVDTYINLKKKKVQTLHSFVTGLQAEQEETLKLKKGLEEIKNELESTDVSRRRSIHS